MSQSSTLKSSKPKTTVYSLKFDKNEDNFELIPHEENDIEEAEESEFAANEVAAAEVIEHVCGICGRGYSSFYTLKTHMKNCTKKEPRIDESYEEYTLEEIRAMQISIKTLIDRNICYCCEENLDTAHSGHIRCQDCFKSFKNVNSYRRHVSLTHSSLPNALPCNICNSKCPTRIILETHLEAHVKGKPYACQKCGKDFTRRYHLIRHQQYSNCDPTKQKDPHKCNVCGKEFFRLDNLRQHLRQHIGNQPRNRDYNCPYCEKSFVGTTILNVHIRTHTGEKPFTCDLCSKGFPSNGALRKHRRSHTGEKPFKCEVCARAFAAKEVLNRHMKTHTGVRPYICSECGKGFIQATQLKTHMFNHTGENGYKCDKCDFQFNRKRSLNEHKDDFHCANEHILDCKVCQIIYEDKVTLTSHLKVVHHGKLYKCRACNKKYLDLINHPNCTKCRFCSPEGSIKSYPHEHLSIKEPTLTVRRAITISADDQQDSLSSNESGKPRKLKILTSKAKKDKVQRKPTTQIVVQKKPDLATTRITRSRKPKKTQAQENNVIFKNDQVKSIKNSTLRMCEPIEIESTIKLEEPDETEPGRMDDETLKECVGQVLNVLLDRDLLAGFGWPDASIEHVLSSVIRQCGHEPADYDSCSDYSTKIRENIKLLFTVVVDNDAFKELLNNHTIDEVVLHILKITSN